MVREAPHIRSAWTDRQDSRIDQCVQHALARVRGCAEASPRLEQREPCRETRPASGLRDVRLASTSKSMSVSWPGVMTPGATHMPSLAGIHCRCNRAGGAVHEWNRGGVRGISRATGNYFVALQRLANVARFHANGRRRPQRRSHRVTTKRPSRSTPHGAPRFDSVNDLPGRRPQPLRHLQRPGADARCPVHRHGGCERLIRQSLRGSHATESDHEHDGRSSAAR
jgi:hypothetical protein